MKKMFFSVLVAMSVLLTACGEVEENKVEQQQFKPEVGSANEDLEKEAVINHDLNDTVNYTNSYDESVDFTVKTVGFDEAENYSQYEESGDLYPNGKFVKITFNAKNIGKVAADVNILADTALLSKDEVEYTSLFSGFQPTNEHDVSGEVKPNLEKEYYSVYNVPEDFIIEGSTLKIIPSGYDEDQINLYKLVK